MGKSFYDTVKDKLQVHVHSASDLINEAKKALSRLGVDASDENVNSLVSEFFDEDLGAFVRASHAAGHFGNNPFDLTVSRLKTRKAQEKFHESIEAIKK